MQRANQFQMRTQSTPEISEQLKIPLQAVGGFRRDLGSFEVRNDYVQHNFSAMLSYFRLDASRTCPL